MNDLVSASSSLLLLTLAVLALRLSRGAPELRERLAWWVLAGALAYTGLHRGVSFLSSGYQPPLEQNLLLLTVLLAATATVVLIGPTIVRQRGVDAERRHAEERFRRAIEGSSEPAALVDASGRYRYVNAAACALFQYRPEQVIGRHYGEFLEGWTERGRHTAQAMDDRRLGLSSVVRSVRRSDGGALTVAAELISLGDGNLLFIGHDITERLALEGRLERERVRLRLAQDVSHVGSGETDLRTGERWWSPELYRLFGFEPADEPPPQAVARERIHPDDRECYERAIEPILRGEEHEPLPFRLVLPSGEIRHVLMHAHVEHDGDGRPVRVTRVLIDITGLQALQAELERERTRLRYAQEVSRAGSVEVDVQTGATWWSEEFRRLVGMPPGSQQRSWEAFLERVHAEDRTALIDGYARLAAGHQPSPSTIRLVMPDGTVRSALWHMSLERDEAGEPHILTGVLADVTEFLRLQDELGRAKRLEAIGTLTAGIAHDFNNLLTVIGGSIELATLGEPSRLEHACHAVQRAAGLVRQLLQFSRADGEGQGEATTLVDLRSVVAEAVEALGTDGVRIVRLDLPAQPVIATVDPSRVHRVLLNLLVNARDAVQEAAATAPGFEPSVQVRLATLPASPGRDAGAELMVSDNGVGMPPEVLDRAFEPFFTTKPPGRGTGLGLATVYGVVRDLNGSIEVSSTPGAGTTFRVWLPLAPAAAPAPAGGTRRRAHVQQVLILDDEPDVLDFASEVLSRAGFTVTAVGTSAEALACIEERPFDLAILDAFVDSTPIADTLRLIRAVRPGQDVMVWSGTANRAQALAWGADEFLAKPFDGERLLRAVSEAVAVRGPVRQGEPTRADG